MSTFKKVQEFHKAFDVKTLEKSEILQYRFNKDLIKLRLNLILEELCELANACGCVISVENDGVSSATYDVDPLYIGLLDLVEIADALGDIDYVVAGFADVLNIPHDQVVAEIHASNMSKLDDAGKPILRSDGKILKGPNYYKPNIGAILAGHITHKSAN